MQQQNARLLRPVAVLACEAWMFEFEIPCALVGWFRDLVEINAQISLLAFGADARGAKDTAIRVVPLCARIAHTHAIKRFAVTARVPVVEHRQ